MKFLKHLWRRLPYITFYTVLVYVLLSLGQQAYYKYMPAEYFLNYYKATPRSTQVGEPLHMELCRTKHYSNFKLQATRTFLMQKVDPANDFVPVYDYSYEPTIESGGECQDIILSTKRQPQKAGTYYIHTEADFYVNGYKKTIEYDSDRYTLTANDKSVQERINDLQRQIDELRKQLTPAGQAQASAITATPNPNVFTSKTPAFTNNTGETTGGATPSGSGSNSSATPASSTPDNDGVVTPKIFFIPSVHIPSPF